MTSLFLLYLLTTLTSTASTASPYPSCDPHICACAEFTVTDDGAGAEETASSFSVDCGERGLLGVPTGLPPSTAELSLSGNELKRVNSSQLAALAGLARLDVSRNELDGFSGEFLISVP